MESKEILEQIKQETNKQEQTGLYVTCPACGDTNTWKQGFPTPNKCIKCGAEGTFAVGNSERESKMKAGEMARAKVNTSPVNSHQTIEVDRGQEQAPVNTTPTTKPKRAPAKVKQAEQKTEQTTETAATAEPADRQASVIALTNEFSLNTVQPKKVGQAQVYALGFTEWIEKDEKRVPNVTIKEPTDDAQSFRELLTNARKRDGRVCVDVARLTGFNSKIASCLFSYTLDASIFSPSGPISVKVGDTVEVAAKVSNSGGLIWSVIKVV